MKIAIDSLKAFAIAVGLACISAACGHSDKHVGKAQPGNAILEIPTRIDMGDIVGPSFKKFTYVFFRNTGTDTLYIYAVTPTCDCTETVLKDSVLAPGATGTIEAYLDLSEYVAGPIEKDFSIWSSNSEAKEVFVTLVGTKK